MKKLKRILRKLLFPGAAIVIFSALIGAGLLAYTFLAAGEDTPIAYVSYAVSSYALVILCANLVPIFQKGRRQVCKNPYIRRYMEDISFKLRFSLHCSLAVNLLYAGVNAFSGIWYRSPWFGSLAAYYIFLSVMRVSLVRYAHKHGFGENMPAEWRRYQLCGIVLALMNIALAGVVILVIHQDKGFEYAGSLIYAMAAYTFYIAISAVVNVVRYRKYHSPVMSAAKVVNLVAALVSMLSLETAMLTRFGGEDPSDFRQIMTGITGGCICGIVVGMGIYMIVHAAGQLKNSRSEI
ncbi:MAG: hypothetical protein DBX58_01975 [Clostridiales bacterium]|nr:MAG: hypothetical protein DBX58_01975 [Clostridiales bacterium]